MLHVEHIKSSYNTASFIRAHQFADQLKELANKSNIDHRGIKVITKDSIVVNNIGTADAIIQWDDGPEEWAYYIEIKDDERVCHRVLSETSIAFYDI